MKVTNESDVKISDAEIIEIVKEDVRINMWNNTSEITVSEDRHVFLTVGFIEPNIPDLKCIGRLNKIMCWGIDEL